jgi:hypothetical protein
VLREIGGKPGWLVKDFHQGVQVGRDREGGLGCHSLPEKGSRSQRTLGMGNEVIIDLPLGSSPAGDNS